MAGEVLGRRDALEDEGVDFLVEHRGAGRLVHAGEPGCGVLEVGLCGVVLPDGGEGGCRVEAADDESHGGGEGYGGACG